MKRAPGQLLTDHEVASMLNVSVYTIRAWRKKGVGPKWHKLGRRKKDPIRYLREDVQAYIDGSASGGGPQPV